MLKIVQQWSLTTVSLRLDVVKVGFSSSPRCWDSDFDFQFRVSSWNSFPIFSFAVISTLKIVHWFLYFSLPFHIFEYVFPASDWQVCEGLRSSCLRLPCRDSIHAKRYPLRGLCLSVSVSFSCWYLSPSLCFFRSFLRWTVSWFGTSDASGLLNVLWIHTSCWRNWIVGVYNWLHWARPAFALVTSREFPLHVSVLFRWAEHKNLHPGTVESLATSRAQLSAQMIAYRASRPFRRRADSAWDEEWERRCCCTLLFPKKWISEWAGTVRIGTWTKERGRWKKGEKQEASYVKILSAKLAVLQNSMVTWRWMVRQRRLVLSLGLSVLFLSLFSSAFVYKFGAALGCDFLKGNLCKNVSPLSSIAAPLPLPQDLHKDLSAQEQFPPPLRHQLPSDLELPRNYSDDELTARVLAQDILSRSTLNIEQPKLAFMFLTPGPLPFEGLWDRFFEVRSPIPKLDCFLLPLQSRFCGWHAQNLNLISVSALYAGPWRWVLCVCPCIQERIIREHLEGECVQRSRNSIWKGMQRRLSLLNFSSELSATSQGDIQLHLPSNQKPFCRNHIWPCTWALSSIFFSFYLSGFQYPSAADMWWRCRFIFFCKGCEGLRVLKLENK